MLRLKKDFFCFFVVKDPDLLYPQHFGILDPDPLKDADPRIRIQGTKIDQKLKKEAFCSINSNLSLFLNGSSSLSIKISEKIQIWINFSLADPGSASK